MTETRIRGRPRGTYKKLTPTNINGRPTKIYTAYNLMLSRCYNPRAKNYEYYGERGISVCDRWRGPSGFDNFFLDMGLPESGLTLGRIDNDKGYGPDNCRWETWKQQAANRRPVGPTPNPNSLRQKALAAGLPYHQVYFRIHRLGWDERRALNTPIQPRGKHSR